MARQLTQLQIFVASPSDVQPERDALGHLVDELNLLWGQTLGISLELIRWETHTHPAVRSDPQAVINEQIPNDYDLFVAILWTRIGTPTPRADSGTVEEFMRALARHRSDAGSVELMVFFKDGAVSPSQLDPEQLAAVNDFRTRVEAEGGLHRSFDDVNTFETTLRLSLVNFVHRWTQQHPRALPSVPSQPPGRVTDSLNHASAFGDGVDEPGFIDLIETIVDSSAALIQVSERMGAALNDFTADIDRRTKEIADAQSAGTLNVIKRATNHVADDMERFVSLMRVEIPELTRHSDQVFTGAGEIASIALDFENRTQTIEQLRSLADSMRVLHGVFVGSAASTAGLRDVVASTPRMTTAYNRARKVVINMLTSLVGELEGAAAAAIHAESTIRALLPPPDQV